MTQWSMLSASSMSSRAQVKKEVDGLDPHNNQRPRPGDRVPRPILLTDVVVSHH